MAELLAAGKMGAALAKLDRMGWVKGSGVVDDYLESLERGKTALIVVPTHQEGDRLTQQIRDRLKADGTVTDERVVRRLRPLNYTQAELREAKKASPEDGVRLTKFAAYREEVQALGVGDVVRATAPLKDLAGRTIETGTLMTLSGWTPAGNMAVTTASGIERVLNADAGHVAAAYTATSQAGQGRTVDHAYLWVPESTFPAVRTDTAYVSGTRGRERLTVYTDNRAGLRAAIQRTDVRLSATDLARIKPHPVRNRLKHRTAWLRRLGAALKQRAVEPLVHLTQAHARSRSR